MAQFKWTDKAQKKVSAQSGFACGVASSAGENLLVPAVAGKKIRVMRYMLNAVGAVNATFTSHESTTAISGLKYMGTTASPSQPPGVAGGYAECGHFETVAAVNGEGLGLNLSAPVAVAYDITYTLED